MRLARTALAALVALALFAGAGAAAPADDGHTASTAAEFGPTADAGPPDELPGPVPDFVGHIVDVVHEVLRNGLGGVLGEAVRGLVWSGTAAASAGG